MRWLFDFLIGHRGRLFGLPMACACWLLATPARADFAVLVQSVTAVAGSTNNTLNVSLTNTGTSAISVGGFAFEIVASPGVTFTSVDTSTTPAYIFAGNSLYGPDISNQPDNQPLPGNKLYALDADASPSGMMLGTGLLNAVGLGDVHFNVAASAAGPISIMVIGFPATNFSDASGKDITNSVGLTVIGGTVTVTPSSTVPEPSSLVLTAIAVAVVVGCWRRQRRQRSFIQQTPC